MLVFLRQFHVYFINFYSYVCPCLGGGIISISWFLVLKDSTVGCGLGGQGTISYRNSQRGLMPTFHCPAQHGDVLCRLRWAGLLLWGGGWRTQGHLVGIQAVAVGGLGASHWMSSVSFLLFSFQRSLAPACSPTLVFHLLKPSVTPNMLSPLPFSLKIVKVCFHCVSGRVLARNRWLAHTGNLRLV